MNNIHIKPENKGKFTALKERTGHSTSWFLQNGTPPQKKMANFARNAAKWLHAYGGFLPSLLDDEFSSIEQQKQMLLLPEVRYNEGGHLFDGRSEYTLLLNDATLMMPIVPKRLLLTPFNDTEQRLVEFLKLSGASEDDILKYLYMAKQNRELEVPVITQGKKSAELSYLEHRRLGASREAAAAQASAETGRPFEEVAHKVDEVDPSTAMQIGQGMKNAADYTMLAGTLFAPELMGSAFNLYQAGTGLYEGLKGNYEEAAQRGMMGILPGVVSTTSLGIAPLLRTSTTLVEPWMHAAIGSGMAAPAAVNIANGEGSTEDYLTLGLVGAPFIKLGYSRISPYLTPYLQEALAYMSPYITPLTENPGLIWSLATPNGRFAYNMAVEANKELGKEGFLPNRRLASNTYYSDPTAYVYDDPLGVTGHYKDITLADELTELGQLESNNHNWQMFTQSPALVRPKPANILYSNIGDPWTKSPLVTDLTLVYRYDPKTGRYYNRYEDLPVSPSHRTASPASRASLSSVIDEEGKVNWDEFTKWLDSNPKITDLLFINRIAKGSATHLDALMQIEALRDNKEISELEYHKLLSEVFNSHSISERTYSLTAKGLISGNGNTNLIEHLLQVVESALKLPLPKGMTRKEFVAAALWHDIGKTIDYRNHGLVSGLLFEEYGPLMFQDVDIWNPLITTPETMATIKDAIEHHMDLDTYANRGLLKALQAADVLRGQDPITEGYKIANVLGYDNDVKIPYKDMTPELELETINKAFDILGLPKVDSSLPLDLWESQIEKRLFTGRSLTRGTSIPFPDETYTMGPNKDKKVLEYVLKQIAGKDVDASRWYTMTPKQRQAEGLPSDSDVYKALAERTFGPDHGRFRFGFNGNDPVSAGFYPRESELLKAQRGPFDANYASADPGIVTSYGDTNPNSRNLVTIPIQPRLEGESLRSWVLRNLLDTYSGKHLGAVSSRLGGNSVDIPTSSMLGNNKTFRIPHLLQRGEDLITTLENSSGAPAKTITNPKIAELEALKYTAGHDADLDYYLQGLIQLAKSYLPKDYRGINELSQWMPSEDIGALHTAITKLANNVEAARAAGEAFLEKLPGMSREHRLRYAELMEETFNKDFGKDANRVAELELYLEDLLPDLLKAETMSSKKDDFKGTAYNILEAIRTIKTLHLLDFADKPFVIQRAIDSLGIAGSPESYAHKSYNLLELALMDITRTVHYRALDYAAALALPIVDNPDYISYMNDASKWALAMQEAGTVPRYLHSDFNTNRAVRTREKTSGREVYVPGRAEGEKVFDALPLSEMGIDPEDYRNDRSVNVHGRFNFSKSDYNPFPIGLFYKPFALGGHLFEGTTEPSQEMYTADEALANWLSAFMNYGQDHPTTLGWKRYYDAATNRGNLLPEVTVKGIVPDPTPAHLIKNMATDIADYVKEDPIQSVLDVTGFIPGVDTFSDIGQVGYDLSKGNWGDAAVSGLAALLPIASASELKGILKGGDEVVEKIAKTVAEEAPRKRRPRIGEMLKTGPIEDPLDKLRALLKKSSPRADSIEEVVLKLVDSSDGGKFLIDEAIKEAMVKDPSFNINTAYLTFSGPFGLHLYHFGNFDRLYPDLIRGKYNWKYADDFKDFKQQLGDIRGITSSNAAGLLDNVDTRYWFNTPKSSLVEIQSAGYRGTPEKGKLVVQSPEEDPVDLFNTGNARMSHTRYDEAISKNREANLPLLNSKVEALHVDRYGNRTYKELKYGSENQTYSLGQEMLMQLYNLLLNLLLRPITPLEFLTFINSLPTEFLDEYVKNVHAGRYIFNDRTSDGTGLRSLLKLFGTTGVIGTAAMAANTVEAQPKSFSKGGPLNKYSKGTEHDLTNDEIFDLIKKGYKISYL